jgi:hypothetical protein
MRIHENGGRSYGRSESACGYCRQTGHNQYECPKVAQDYEFFKDYKIPTDKNGNVSRSGWYGAYPDSWGKWYEHCLKTYTIQQERKKKKTATTPRKSSPRKCGFCGSTKHTRRNCTTMDTFLKDCHAANIKWRTAAYKELVQIHGISVGAAIKVKKHEYSYWQQDSEDEIFSGIITSINWDTLTVFTALDKHHEDAHSPIMIRVLLSNGETIHINNELEKFNCLGEKGAKPSRYSYGTKYTIESIVAPAKQLLDEEWINGYKGAFSTLTKKRSYDELQNGLPSQYSVPNLIKHINGWK